MSNRYVPGRPGVPQGRSGSGGMRSNSKLPKGNQHTTPERSELREAEREKKAQIEEAFIAGRKALNRALEDDQDGVKDVWTAMIGMAKGGHYKAGELVLGYAWGRPVAIQENFSHDLSGDDLFDAVESVREKLSIVPRDEEEAS